MLSRETRLVCGITLLTVPTIFYGGLTLLGILTHGSAGVDTQGLALDATQLALFRAGHAHAGVLVILSLVLQILLDAAALSNAAKWTARIASIIGATFVSGAFFGMAFFPAFRFVLYFGIASMAVSVLTTGVGLIRNPVQSNQSRGNPS